MINVSHLTKCYGSFKAVDDLSFEIENGQVYGFLGPNGAGKSTTMNIMTGCLSPTEGSVSIDGHDILEEPEKAKRLIGYLPEIPPLYTADTPYEYLKFAGEAKGLKGAELKVQIEGVMEETGIITMRDRLISALSKGYRQRVGIAQALLGDPELIILDEPTVGLDPLQIIEIRELIKKLGEKHTVILSSHILSEVQAVCHKVMIISKGRLIAFDTPDNLEHIMTGSGEIRLKARAAKAEADDILSRLSLITEWTSETHESAVLHSAAADKAFLPADKGNITGTAQKDLPDVYGNEDELNYGSTCAAFTDNTSDSGHIPAAVSHSYVSVTARTSGGNLEDICCQLFMAFADRKLPVFELSSHKANLEEVFLELTASGTEAADISEHAQTSEIDAHIYLSKSKPSDNSQTISTVSEEYTENEVNVK